METAIGNRSVALFEMSHPALEEFKKFLKISEKKYLTKKQSLFTNIIDQGFGKCYHFPFISRKEELEDFSNEPKKAEEFESSGNELKIGSVGSVDKIEILEVPINNFFENIEKYRKNGNKILHFSEMQYFHIPNGVQYVYDPVKQSVENDDTIIKNDKKIPVNHSCIEYDFDIYQEKKVKFDEQTVYYPIVSEICDVIFDTIDPESCKTMDKNVIEHIEDRIIMKFFVAVLIKPPTEVNHSEYGNCWKNSFHIRFYIKVRKEVKQYIRAQIIKKNVIQNYLGRYKLLNDEKSIMDAGSCSYPAMIFGNAKRGGTTVHELFKLYFISKETGKKIIISTRTDFEPKKVEIIKIKQQRGKTEEIKGEKTECQYNLSHELSLNYEAPKGVIKKKIFEPFSDINIHINRDSKLYDIDSILTLEDDDVKKRVDCLMSYNYDANWIGSVLSILKNTRFKEYNDWVRIIMAIARESQEFIDLAISASRNCPSSFDGDRSINKIKSLFTEVRERPNHYNNKSFTFRSVEYMAREDNPNEYGELTKMNAYTALRDHIFGPLCGRIEDVQISDVICKYFSYKFRSSEERVGSSSYVVLREFIFPQDTNEYTGRNVYKWVRTSTKTGTLHNFIRRFFPTLLIENTNFIRDRMTKMREDGSLSESDEKYYISILEGIKKSHGKISKIQDITKIIDACCSNKIFLDPGFEQRMDGRETASYIGVLNGVLKLGKDIKLIDTYHSIPISRSMNAEYFPYDPNNPYIKQLEKSYEDIFAGEEDAYEFSMIFLASQLDMIEKEPIFFIWVGDGSNGKSHIVDMQFETFGNCLSQDETGYGGSVSMSYLLEPIKGSAPDSNMDTLAKARSIYVSESNETKRPIDISKIKSILSDTISGNVKYGAQKMVKYNGNINYISNFEPTIFNTEHGAWRRIKYYRFKMKFADPGTSTYDPNNKFCRKSNSEMRQWKSNPLYRNAHLSILTKWYKIYAEKYNRNLALVPSKTIDRETLDYRKSQDSCARYISSKLCHIGKYFEKPKIPVPIIPLSKLAKAFKEWLLANVDNKKISDEQAVTMLRLSSLCKYIDDSVDHKHPVLKEHILIDENENQENLREPTEKMVKAYNEAKQKEKILEEMIMEESISESVAVTPKIHLTKSADILTRRSVFSDDENENEETRKATLGKIAKEKKETNKMINEFKKKKRAEDKKSMKENAKKEKKGNKIKNSEMNDTEINDTEINDTEINDAEMSGPEMNDTEINDAEMSDSEMKDIKIKDVKIKDRKQVEKKDLIDMLPDIENNISDDENENTSEKVPDIVVSEAEDNAVNLSDSVNEISDSNKKVNQSDEKKLNSPRQSKPAKISISEVKKYLKKKK